MTIIRNQVAGRVILSTLMACSLGACAATDLRPTLGAADIPSVGITPLPLRAAVIIPPAIDQPVTSPELSCPLQAGSTTVTVSPGAMIRTTAVPVLSQAFRAVDHFSDRSSIKNSYDVYIEFAPPKMFFARDCDTWWHLLEWLIPPVGTLVLGPADSFAGWPTVQTSIDMMATVTNAQGVVLLNRTASSGGTLLTYGGGAQSIALNELSIRFNNMFAGIFATLASEVRRSTELEQYARARHEAETARLEMERNAKMAAVTSPEQAAVGAERAGKLREAFAQYALALEALHKVEQTPDLQAARAEAFLRLRERILKVSQRLMPPPAIPEGAERRVLRGKVAFKQATKPADNAPAIAEFEEAVRLAPWWSDAYFNLALAQEKAGRLADAIGSYRWYLTASPEAKDFQEVKDKVVELEYMVEQQQKVR